MKILIITQGIWTPRLGAVKVHIDLKEEYERLGFIVEKFSLDDMYPNGENFFLKIFGKKYPQIVFDFLKKNAYRFDIIDTNYHCIVHNKEEYNFNGIVLCRSQGLKPVYVEAEKTIPMYKQTLEEHEINKSIKTRIGDIYRMLQKKVGDQEFFDSIKYADIVHCHNKAEFDYLRSIGVAESKIIEMPNGIPDEFIEHANSIGVKCDAKSIAFIGSWTLRKGIMDLNNILKGIESNLWDMIYLMGGGDHITRHNILKLFDAELHRKIVVIPSYDKEDLFSVLNNCKLAIFPSYIEGFPLSVIEFISFGIPVVAYKVPGTEEALAKYEDQLLVEPGDFNSFSEKANNILRMDNVAYQTLSNKCKKLSQTYKISKVTTSLIERFEFFLKSRQKDK